MRTLRKEIDRRRRVRSLDVYYLSKDEEYMNYNTSSCSDDDNDDDESMQPRIVSQGMVNAIAETLRREEVVKYESKRVFPTRSIE